MAFIGSSPTTQNFSPAIDYFNGDGVTIAFTLSRPVASVAQVQAVINNVPQNPSSAYTVSGNTITFTSAPSSGTSNIYVYYTSPITQVVALPQDPQVFGNLQFSSLGARIRGDFSNATLINRVAYQTSTTNGNTNFLVLPNGTATGANIQLSNASDPSNASIFAIQATNTEARLNSAISGTGTYLPITFYTNGAERVRIDTSGNMGIGEINPSSKLEVAGTGANNAGAKATYEGTIKINEAGSSTLQATGGLEFKGSVFGSGYGSKIFSTDAGALLFGTRANSATWSERMRIDNNGNLLVGVTSLPSASVFGFAVNNSSVGFPYLMNSTNTTGAGASHFQFYNPNGLVGSITTTGSTTAYNTTSDYRLKENIQPMQNALATVAQLKPVTYTWKADGSAGQGFIAHELQSVAPDCVTGEKDALQTVDDLDANGKKIGTKEVPKYQGIDTSFLVATLTAAIQEQQAIISQLQADVAALKGN